MRPPRSTSAPQRRFVAGFVGTSNLLTGRCRPGRSSGKSGTFTVRPEKIRLAEPDATVGPDETSALGTIRKVVYLGPDTRFLVALDAGAEARRHPTEPGDLLDGGARPRGQGCPPDLEATAQFPRRRVTGTDSAARSSPGGWRRSMNKRRIAGAIGVIAIVGGCLFERDPAPRSNRACRPRSGPTEGALNLVAWTQYVMGGSGGEDVPEGGYDWVKPFEDCDRLQGQREGRGQLVRDGPADEDRRVRRRVGFRRRDVAAHRRRRRLCRQHGPHPELRERLRRASRTSRTTPSTAWPTAFRTDAARTC